MSLIAVPPPPQSPANTAVAGDGWWPDIDCNAMRDVLRLGDVITHARLVAAIEGGMITVTDELRDWRGLREADGHTTLSAVAPADLINGAPRLATLFTRAVRFAAAAELAELHRELSATYEGEKRSDTQLLSASDYRRLSTHAIRDMLGETRTAVELI
jgi:hypothetical protein